MTPRGGKRPGAGRPRSRRVRLQAYVDPEIAEAVERAADDACLEVQDWLRRVIGEAAAPEKKTTRDR